MFLWDSFSSSVYLINRLPVSNLHSKCAFEILFHHKPDYHFLKVFGCSFSPLLRPYQSHKFSFRTSKCVSLGYSSVHKGYKCLYAIGRVYIARYVTFNKEEFPYPDLFSVKSSVTVSKDSFIPIFLDYSAITTSSTNVNH